MATTHILEWNIGVMEVGAITDTALGTCCIALRYALIFSKDKSAITLYF